MSNELNIRDAAHTIRSHLRELLDDTQAKTFEHKLDTLLAKAESDEKAEEEIADLLCSNPVIRKWTDKFMNEDEMKKSYADSSGGYTEFPGKPSQTPGMKKYVCREKGCKEYWYRRDIGEEIPECLIHRKRLIPERK